MYEKKFLGRARNSGLARESHEDELTQEFITVDGISEEIVIGLDALYGHRFMFDEREQTIYRLREAGQFSKEPFMVVSTTIKIRPHTL